MPAYFCVATDIEYVTGCRPVTLMLPTLLTMSVCARLRWFHKKFILCNRIPSQMTLMLNTLLQTGMQWLIPCTTMLSWWRNGMDNLLTLCEENPPVTAVFTSQRTNKTELAWFHTHPHILFTIDTQYLAQEGEAWLPFVKSMFYVLALSLSASVRRATALQHSRQIKWWQKISFIWSNPVDMPF